MDDSEELIDVLNGLIVINNDRIDGYEKAASGIDDFALKALFESMAKDSRKHANELALEVARRGGSVATGTSTAGDLYRVWMDIKAAITGKNSKSILSYCETGEDVALNGYDIALKTDAELPVDLRLLVITQQENVKAAHDEIKMLRDSVVVQ